MILFSNSIFQNDKQKRAFQITITVVAVIWACFQLYTAYFGIFPILQQRSVHLLFAMAIIFIIYPFGASESLKGQFSIGKIALIILTIISLGYIVINHMDIWTQTGRITPAQIIISLIVLLLILEATRRTIGYSLPIIVLIFIGYAYIGNMFSGALHHKGYNTAEILRYQIMGVEGVFGIALGVASTFVFLFILYAAVLNISGAGDIFIDLAKGLVGKVRGGPAKISVIASGLFGSISGSAVANTAGTGSFTIPLMKKTGYSSRFAGAVEAVSSTGGQFMPPIMGAAAFLIAEVLQIPFWEVVISAAIPAILFYVSVFIVVDVEAIKKNVRGLEKDEVPKITKTLSKGWHLLLSPLVLVYLLLIVQLSPMKAGFWAIVVTILSTFINPKNRMSISSIILSMRKGAIGALETTVACASIGIVIGVIMQTGIGFQLSSLLVNTANGNLLLLLLLTMLASLVLGMGLPTVAAYLVLGVMVAPALIQLGVNPLAAHLFIFYFGIISAITPPVALASIVAAGISGDRPMSTSLTALRLGAPAFILPFMFVFEPALILKGSITVTIISVITAIIGLFSLAFGLQQFFIRNLKLVESACFLIIAISLIFPGYITDAIGIIAMLCLMIFIKVTTKDKETRLSSIV
ncbi:TRAP transporter permease [Virgibacillus sp. W0430]|uniref:TRAP transporter permease n=1 Tax=Virgibacillus sp. W0430 TaxID=3391580 RepID=UPI003F45594B